MKEKIIIISSIVLILTIIIVIVIITNKKESKISPKKLSPEEKVVEETKAFNNMLTDIKSKSEIEKYIGTNFSDADILTGPDSYTRKRLTDEQKEGKDFSKYEKASDKYSDNLEKYIKNNFEYEIISHSTDPVGNIGVTYRFKSYYYLLYTRDLEEIKSRLLVMQGYNLEEFDGRNNQNLQEDYKAKIKSMEIMDSYLENYINKDEYLTRDLVYLNGEKVETNYYSYMLNFKGHTYKNVDFSNPNFISLQNERVTNYINEAIKKKILNIKKPLELK